MFGVPRLHILLFVGLYVPLCVVAFDVARVVRAAVKRLRGRGALRELLAPRAVVHHAAAAAIVLLWLYAWGIEPYRLRVVREVVPTAKLSGGPFRIVQISDVHCETKVRNEPKLAGIVNPLQPDILVFTGDALNTYDGIPLFRKTMAGLEARLGKFAVPGNVDALDWRERGTFEGTGFDVLEGRTVRVGRDTDAVYVTGLTYGQWQPYQDLLKEVPAGHVSVLLYHSPDLADRLAGLNVDLYLCRHTHGGQIALPFYGPMVFLRGACRKYRCGRYTVGRTLVYVNPGIGMEAGAPRVRFRVRPEVTVLDLVPAPAAP
jgi:predicted MPP superfamily phosphohydrolase